MTKTMMSESRASDADQYETSSRPNSNGFYKIVFDEKIHVSGLSVLVDSRLSFTCLEDGFIVGSKHRELLNQSNIVYEVVKG